VWEILAKLAFIYAFAKLRKAAIVFVMIVCPSARMEQLRSHCKDFHEIWYLSIFRKSVKKFQVSLKSDKNIRYFNPLIAQLNRICHLLALLGVHHILYFSRIRVNARRNVIDWPDLWELASSIISVFRFTQVIFLSHVASNSVICQETERALSLSVIHLSYTKMVSPRWLKTNWYLLW
jgi:hypothetical protein